MPRPSLPLAALLLSCPAILAQQRVPEDFQLGLGLQQRGMHEEAERKFAAFLRAEPGHELAAEACYRRAVSLLQVQKKDEGRQSLEQALRVGGRAFPLRHEARYRLAQVLHEGGDHAGAGRHLATLLADLPKDHYLLAAAQFSAGECWRDQNDDEKALAAFTAAAAAAAAAATGEDGAAFRFPALYQAGFAALRLQQFALAAHHFGTAHGAAPDEAGKHETGYLTGDALLRAGKPGDAKAWLEAARAGKGEYADDAALTLGFCAVAERDQDGALAAFRRCVDQHGKSPLAPRARLEIGRLLYQRKDYAGADRELRPLAEAADQALAAAARELLGLTALASGSGAAAVPTLRAALAAAPASERPRLSFALAEALADAKDWAGAVEHYDAAAQGAGGDEALRGDALYGASFALHSLGRYDDSTARATTLRKELPKHRLAVLATFATAENRFLQQRYADAAKDYAAVPAGAEVAPQAAFKLAWCSYLQKKYSEAAQRFAAIAERQGHPDAEEALAMAALAQFEAGAGDTALALADAYRARYPQGSFADRTERIAGRVLRQRGDLAGAAQRFQRAGKSSKDAGPDELEQAEVQFQRGDFKAAAAVYERLGARNDAVGARALEGLAWCAFELGDDTACAERLQRAMQHPGARELRPGLLELASALHHRQRDWAAAIADATAFLREFAGHPKAPAMTYALGVAEARAGQHAAAMKTLQALAQRGGYDRMDRVHYELAWAARRAGQEPVAQQSFAVVAKDSQDLDLAGEAKLHLGTQKLQSGDEKAARALLQDVQGRYRGRALYELAVADHAAADQDASRLALAKNGFDAVAALEGEALAPEALFLAADCCRRTGDHAGTAERTKRLLQQAPQHERAMPARLWLAEAAAALGDGDVAVQRGTEFLAADPKDKAERARAQLAVGRGRQLRNEHERAEAAFVAVTELSDGALAAEAQFRIGESRAARGEFASAVDAFVKLPILYAHAEWVAKGLLQAGLAYERLQQQDKAARLYRELLERFPDAPEAAAARARLDPK